MLNIFFKYTDKTLQQYQTHNTMQTHNMHSQEIAVFTDQQFNKNTVTFS